MIPRAKVVSLDRGRAGVWLAGLDELEAMVNRKAELANDVDAKALEVRILSHELSGANGKDAHAEMTKIMAEIEPMLGVES